MSAPTLPFPQSLAEKYRPRTIAEFVGLDKPKHILAKFAAQPYQSAWLFVGPSGVGKTSMAQALCSQIKGELTHIPSQKCTAQAIEEACYHCHFVPLTGGFHVVLIDEADRMTPSRAASPIEQAGRDCIPTERRIHHHL